MKRKSCISQISLLQLPQCVCESKSMNDTVRKVKAPVNKKESGNVLMIPSHCGSINICLWFNRFLLKQAVSVLQGRLFSSAFCSAANASMVFRDIWIRKDKKQTHCQLQSKVVQLHLFNDIKDHRDRDVAGLQVGNKTQDGGWAAKYCSRQLSQVTLSFQLKLSCFTALWFTLNTFHNSDTVSDLYLKTGKHCFPIYQSIVSAPSLWWTDKQRHEWSPINGSPQRFLIHTISQQRKALITTH